VSESIRPLAPEATAFISRNIGEVMTNTPVISSKRLDLIPLTPAFLQASLRGESTTAESLLGLAIPSEWFAEQRLIQVRLNDLQHNSALQPCLLRAIGLRRQRVMVGHIGFHTQPGRLLARVGSWRNRIWVYGLFRLSAAGVCSRSV
jgi:hypothetical protein